MTEIWLPLTSLTDMGTERTTVNYICLIYFTDEPVDDPSNHDPQDCS